MRSFRGMGFRWKDDTVLTMCNGIVLFFLCVLCFLWDRGLVPDRFLVLCMLVCVLLQRHLCLRWSIDQLLNTSENLTKTRKPIPSKFDTNSNLKNYHVRNMQYPTRIHLRDTQFSHASPSSRTPPPSFPCSFLTHVQLWQDRWQKHKRSYKETQNIPFGVSNTNLISADLVNGTASFGSFSSFKIPIVLYESVVFQAEKWFSKVNSVRKAGVDKYFGRYGD